MAKPTFEFDPLRSRLYTADELLDGFDPDRPASYAEMRDTLIYREFIAAGGGACSDHAMSIGRALHDNAIGQAIAGAVSGEKIVAIMGGHACSRRDTVYTDTARLAARLAGSGFTLASGGGPGIMEATHLGAAFGSDEGLDDALKALAADDVPAAIPANAGHLVKDDGTIDPDIAQAMGQYLAPAVRIMRSLGRSGGLGIPTWLYGHEPTTPFARPIAKYFQNSIREDGLLALATNGIIYLPGSAGTLQEVFQDAAQNYYKTFPTGPGKTGEFSPMVFYGDFWTKTVKVKPVLKALFGKPAKKPHRNIGNDYRDRVRYLSDPDAVVAHLQKFAGRPSTALDFLRATTSIAPSHVLDMLFPSTVLVDSNAWSGQSAYLTAYADGECYNPQQTWNIPRLNLHKLADAGTVQACDLSGSMSATQCSVH